MDLADWSSRGAAGGLWYRAKALALQSSARSRHALFELLLTLLLVGGVIGGYALANGRITLAGVELVKVEPQTPSARPLRRRVTALALRLRTTLRAIDKPVGSDLPEPSQPPVDATKHRILMFGDSMIDELMLRMADYCEENGHTLHPAIWYGSTLGQWAKRERLERLLKQYEPTFAIVVLGSTELTSSGIERRRPAIHAITSLLDGVPFVWLGPPSWKRDTGITDLIEDVVGSERFFHSDRLELEREWDGIHPTRAAAAGWMDAFATWLASDSAHPIQLDFPRTKAARPRAQVFPPG